MDAYEIAEVEAQRVAAARLYQEFLRVPSISAGLYVLEAGADDPQGPHQQDEIYYVIAGRAQIQVDGEDRAVQAGSVVFVAKHVEHSIARGLDVDEFAPRLSFFFNAHIDFFEEIAKYRAARRIWARVLRERYGAKTERALLMRFHTQTAGVSLTAQQPQVNIVRTAIEALAAVLGGTQSLHTNSYDEALALPTEHAARLALRTQQVIAHETGVTSIADPLGGSWLVESLQRVFGDYKETPVF